MLLIGQHLSPPSWDARGQPRKSGYWARTQCVCDLGAAGWTTTVSAGRDLAWNLGATRQSRKFGDFVCAYSVLACWFKTTSSVKIHDRKINKGAYVYG